jgi:hypothetical protein
MIKKVAYTVKQSDLASECWIIQIRGLPACKKCEFLDTENCSGKRIRKAMLAGEKKPVEKYRA